MSAEEKREEPRAYACPLCAIWAACKDSDIAKHARGIQRESLLLGRSLLDICLTAAERQLSARRTGNKTEK